MIFTNILQLLIEYVQKGDLTVFQAIAMTKDILFNNSNVLYDLRYQATFDETIQEGPKQLTYNTKPATGSSYPSPSIPPIPPAGSTTHPAPTGPIDPRSGSPYEPPNFPPPPTVPHVYDNQVFDSFMKENPDVRFVYVQWLDYMATIRARVVPIKEFTRMIREGDRIGISQGNTGTLQNDTLTSIVNTTGQIYVEPDLRSLRRTHNKDRCPPPQFFLIGAQNRALHYRPVHAQVSKPSLTRCNIPTPLHFSSDLKSKSPSSRATLIPIPKPLNKRLFSL
jgi:hypothetical protein